MEKEIKKKTKNAPKKTKKQKKDRKKIKRIILSVLAILLVGIAFACYKFRPVYVETKKKVFEVTSGMSEGTFRRDGNTYVYDKDGKKIGKIGNEKYTYVKCADISSYIKNGYIAQEDTNFATHHGYDPKAILRAAVSAVKNRKITQGGSTITQQVVKNNLLSSERTFSRKFTELFVSMSLEKTYSKAQIMEFYCNSNYYGNGCYGVEGAAQYYFGKSAKNVTLAEAAMIVGTSNRPNSYNPVDSYEQAERKKEQVLKNMKEQGYITNKEYKQAMKEQPKVVQKTDKTDSDNYMVSYAVHCATLRLMENQGFEFKYTFSSQKEYKKYKKSYSSTYSEMSKEIRAGGYKIYTSFDQQLQKRLQKTVKNKLTNKELEAAAVCIDNESQMVVAIVGGRSTKDEYNRGFLMSRNPGSSIKPLLDYGPALNEGKISAGSTVTDEKVDYSGYSPKNANGAYLGKMTTREALARSVNTIGVKLFMKTGNKTCLSYLDKMRFSSICYADSYIASIALGGFTYGVKPVDMAKGYATIANGGKYSDNDCITKIEKENGEVVYTNTDDEAEVYNEDTAYILTDMMQGVFREEYGTAHELYKKGKIYAGKTGTTNDNKDAWFCGFSTDYTLAVWTGCDNPKSIDGLVGSSYPADIFVSFMDTLSSGSFKAPSTVYLANDNGATKTAPDTPDNWAARPSDYDYESELNAKKREAQLLKERIKKEKSAAEKAVSAFEDFTIKDTDDAKNLEEKYNSVLETISEIEDTSEQASYKERTAYKYGLLSGDVKDKWDKVIEEEKAAAQEKKKLQEKENAADSEEEALSTLQSKKKEVVNWYVNALYQRSVYSDSVKEMITDAKAALSDYQNYDDYNTLKTRLDAAISYAQALPTQEEIEEQANNVQIPSDSDYSDDSTSTTTTENNTTNTTGGNSTVNY